MEKKEKKQKIKTGIMGGSFDPFHLAHLNSLLTVKERFALDEILLIPSFKTPLKDEIKEINPFHRLEMLKQTVKDYSFINVDDQEICRKGVSYTYKTVSELIKKRKQAELFLIIGLDQFYVFDKWKNYEKILQKTHLIVTSRPGSSFPKRKTDLPPALKALVKTKKADQLILKAQTKKSQTSKLSKNPDSKGTTKQNKKTDTKEITKIIKKPEKIIYFCELKDLDISSSDIRKRMKEGSEFSHLLPKEVSSYITENKLYTNQAKAPDHTKSLMDFSVEELKKKKAYDIKLYNLKSKPLPFSFAVIAVASNTRQTLAIAKHLKKAIKERFDLKVWSEEGKDSANWIALDYGDLVFHIFYDYSRKFYNLEELWESCLIDS